MSDEAKTLTGEVIEKLDAMNATLSDGQRAQVVELVENTVKAQVAARAPHARVYRPGAPPAQPEDALLDGTTYGRLGMTIGDVELVHDILNAARVADPRLTGPNDVTRNIVATARKQRAMDTAESGFGSQLVPDAVYVPQLWDQARQQYGFIVNNLETRTMQGPIEKHPVLANVPFMIYVGETTDAISAATEYGTQKVGSQEVTLTATKMLAHYNYSGELVEDSIVPLVPLLRNAFAITLAKTADSAILNGDTTNGGVGNWNYHDADPPDTAHYLAFDGIRHAFLTDNTNNRVDASASLTYEKIVNLPTLMIDRTYDMHWGRPANPNRLAFICNPELEDDILTLSELMTINTYGPNATVNTMGQPLNGEFVRIGRHPLISTIAMKQTAADGGVDAADNGTKGTIAAVNFDGMLWGIRRQAQIETERRAGTDQWRLIMSTRVALGRFSPTGAASGIEWAAGLYNI